MAPWCDRFVLISYAINLDAYFYLSCRIKPITYDRRHIASPNIIADIRSRTLETNIFFLSAHPNQTHSGLIDLDGLRFKERLHTPWLWLLGGSKDRLPPNRGKLNPAPSNVHQQLRRTIHEERDIRSLRNFNNPASYELNEKHEHIWLASRIITHGDDELIFFFK